MRLLFCSQAAHTGGGVEVWMESLSSILERRGIEVFTALAKGRFHDPERYQQAHRVANPIVVDGSRGYRENRIAELLRVLDEVRPDIVIPLNLEDALFASTFAKHRGADLRIVFCIHGQGEDRLHQIRMAAPFVDLVVSVSRRMADCAAAIVGHDRVRHIPTGVPVPAADIRPRDHLASLAYVGRLEADEKRTTDLITLGHFLPPEVALHVVGAGPAEEALRAGVAATFHGHLSREALYETIYPRMDAIVVLSPAEAGPIVAWEAMAHGVVPIVSDYVGRAEEGVIRDDETGVVFPVGDMRTAADKIGRLTAPGALTPLSTAARAGLPAAYGLPVFEERWLSTLDALVATKMRLGAAEDLPQLSSPGRMSRLVPSSVLLARIRRLLRQQYLHQEAGSEWPH